MQTAAKNEPHRTAAHVETAPHTDTAPRIDVDALLKAQPTHPAATGFPVHTPEYMVFASEKPNEDKQVHHDLKLLVLTTLGVLEEEILILSDKEYDKAKSLEDLRSLVKSRATRALDKIHDGFQALHPMRLKPGIQNRTHATTHDLKLHFDPSNQEIRVLTPQGKTQLRHQLATEKWLHSGSRLCQRIDPMLAGAWASRQRDFIVLRFTFDGQVDTCRQAGDRFEILRLPADH